jgi:hypothetical protein
MKAYLESGTNSLLFRIPDFVFKVDGVFVV